MVSFLKTPNAMLDYGFNWTSWLTSGEVIASSVWTVTSGLTVVSSSNTDTQTTIWISGGVAFSNYSLVNKITTSLGRIDERTIKIFVRQR
jgi:hypothetical protein